MNKTSVVSQSTLTDRYQTTVPATVRKALHLNKRDKLNFTVLDDGKVLVTKAEEKESDPILGEFLSFLESDMKTHPEHIHALSGESKARADALIADVFIDLDEPLNDEDE